jgi:hypothetical protein
MVYLLDWPLPMRRSKVVSAEQPREGPPLVLTDVRDGLKDT